ncbi:STAS domain-containing protein [Mycobacterium sp. Marseille-P9652]|uniref:STAS domain-containing protein n=1 Tax=Mycobacterium sp. Marseille-P9652 TaxID=2654950 RepID=UPI0012E6FC7B|nr:STAS domain-containing protein [Mycobacterium sp. Marseille-P9652]
MNVQLTATTSSRSACLRVTGPLDYETTTAFMEAVDRLLNADPGPAHLHLDLAGLTFCDSAGLSGLLLAHRHAQRAGAHLHLDHRPEFLDRILDVTGTFDHLVAPSALGEQGETGVR